MPTTEQKEQGTATPLPKATAKEPKAKAPETVTSNDVGEQTETKASLAAKQKGK